MMNVRSWGIVLFLLVCAIGLPGFSCGPTLKDCQLDKDCGSTQQCLNYRCRELDSCSSDKDCSAPRTCVQKRCRAPQVRGCQSDKDCTAPRVCQRNQCTTPTSASCKSNKDCKNGEQCEKSRCVPSRNQGCQSDKDCGTGEICKNKVCTKPPSKCKTDADCSAGQYCRELTGKCESTSIQCRSDADCAVGQECKGGQCVGQSTKCRTNADCSAGQYCRELTGKCESTSVQCRRDADCATGEECKGGQCVGLSTKCRTNADCPAGQTCQNDKCVTQSTKCNNDADCGQGEVCNNGVCKSSQPPCRTNADCAAGQKCENNKCVPKTAGTCKFSASNLSLYFGKVEVGKQKTMSFQFTNVGTGTCQISQVTVRTTSGSAGSFIIPKLSPHSFAPQESIAFSATFVPKATGLHNGKLEALSGNVVTTSVSLAGDGQPGSNTSGKGWEVVYVGSGGFGDENYISGCFWSNTEFEVVSAGRFLDGGFNPSTGNIRKTTDGGKQWKCVNCTQGQGFPRTARYEIVDMTIRGMTCHKGRGYIHGVFDHSNPAPSQSTLFTRTGTKSWTQVKDKNNPLTGGSYNAMLLAEGGDWFWMDANLFVGFTPQSDGKFQTSKVRLASKISSTGTRKLMYGFHRAQKTALIFGAIRALKGGKFTYQAWIATNTNNGELPAGADYTNTEKYWPSAKAPCSNCFLRAGHVLGPKSLMVAAQQNGTGGIVSFDVYRSENLGQSWTKVYTRSSKHLSAAKFVQLDSKRIILVAGRSHQGGSLSAKETGLLLESRDTGKSFQAIATSSIKGKALPNGTLPSLFNAHLSPDGKTLFVVGNGLIIRYKQ